MNKKYKRQRRNIIIKITAVLFAVWLIVSAVFSAIVLNNEKETQITKSHNDYVNLVDGVTSFAMPYNEMCLYLSMTKERWRDYVLQDLDLEEITCGADIGTYDRNMQITLYEYLIVEDDESFPFDKKLIMDTDKEIFLKFRPDDFSEYTGDSGILNYDEFANSMTPDQLDSIVDYLNTEKDEDGYFYLLLHKECYYNPENGHVYPKTVEIVKAYEDSYGYAIGETVKTYDLNVKITDKLERYETNSTNEPYFIEGKFVCNNFASEGLIEDPTESLSVEFYDPDKGIVEENDLFTYTCHESGTYTIETVDFEGSEQAYSYLYEQTGIENLNEDSYEDIYIEDYPTQYVTKNIGLRYAKRFNLLECCGDVLAIGISSIFLFFLIIGLILTIMMCKVLKTQMTQEQKRIEVTNALAHDIKTPLFIISGYAQNLKENVNIDKREHYCDRIIERTQEVDELIHKMLDFSSLENIEQKLDLSDVDLNAVIRKTIDEFENIAGKKLFKINTTESCQIKADKNLITQALSNLIDNAVKYSDEETEIVIDISEKSFAIANTCSIITNEDIKLLTQPYYRADKTRESKGSGLGLSIVKTILDLHNYKLDIKLDGNMITFTVIF